MTDLYTLHRGDAPLLISIPHVGTEIPESLRPLYTDIALTVADTDWHLDRLYDFAREMGATILGARISRYVIDLNRPSNDESLYPGQTTTGLCPGETFRGMPLYRDGVGPDATELARLRAAHPNVLLWEAHSIASVLPRLFEGKLPDLNIGTQDGRTAAPGALQAVTDAAARSAYTWIANGRFKGGYNTRHYGAPETGVHAIQLEMCQSTYMDETEPFDYAPEAAGQVQVVVKDMVGAALDVIRGL